IYAPFLLSPPPPPRVPHSFPTRRSSDLGPAAPVTNVPVSLVFAACTCRRVARSMTNLPEGLSVPTFRSVSHVAETALSACSRPRSEEHTSELQSRVDLVCRLLLEKKNNK